MVIPSEFGETRIVSGFESTRFAPQPSTPCTTTTQVPHAVGVPAMTPVVELIVTPAGSVPDAIDHVTAPTLPVAAAAS